MCSTFPSSNTLCLTNSKIVYCLVCPFLFCSTLFAFLFVYLSVVVFSFLFFLTFRGLFFFFFFFFVWFRLVWLVSSFFQLFFSFFLFSFWRGWSFFQPRLNADLWPYFYFSPFSRLLPCQSFLIFCCCFLFICLFVCLFILIS